MTTASLWPGRPRSRAPLPPMPIANVAVTAAAPDKVTAAADETTAEPQAQWMGGSDGGAGG